MTSWTLRTLFLSGALILAACASASGDPVTQAPSEPPTSVPSENPNSEAVLAPDFEISVYQGLDELGSETVMLSDVLELGKPVVLNFWAGLCPPCRLEMPDFQEISDERGSEFILLGIDIGPFTALGTRDEGRALLEELQISYPAGTTFDSSVVVDYRVFGMPSTYFITADGEIVNSWTGLLTKEKISELIDELIAESP